MSNYSDLVRIAGVVPESVVDGPGPGGGGLLPRLSAPLSVVITQVPGSAGWRRNFPGEHGAASIIIPCYPE